MSDAVSLGERYKGWAVVAGASNGLGEAFALALAASGFDILLVARNRSALDALAGRIRDRFGVQAEILALDLSGPDAPERLNTALGMRPIGLYIYCAGADSLGTSLLASDFSDWRKLIALNVLTLTETVRDIAGQMVEKGNGAIVIVSSEAAFGGTARAAVYAGTKAYGLNFGESLWAELKPKGVDVLSIVIGATNTPALLSAVKKHGVSVDLSLLAQPETIAARALASLHDGPTLIFSEDALADPAHSAAGRRAHVERTSAYLASFYGPDESAGVPRVADQ